MSVLDRLVVQGKSFSQQCDNNNESCKPSKLPSRRDLIALYRLSQIRKRTESARQSKEVVISVEADGTESDRSRRLLSARRSDESSWDSNRNKCGIKWDVTQGTNTAEGKYTLSQAEYRKFNQQVRDANLYNSNNNASTFRGVGYKKYFNPKASQDCNAVYRSQLASSLKAFKPKAWAALDPAPVEEPAYFRCRSFRNGSDASQTHISSKSVGSRCSTPGVTANGRVRSAKLQRPQSVPANALYKRSESPAAELNDTGPYDTLTPDILYELSNCYAKDTWYGERPYSAFSMTSGLDKSVKDSDLSSTSGLGSDKDSDKEDDDDEEEEDTKVLGKDSDLSDDEDIPEPSVDQERSAPNLVLRPEKLDSLYIPEGRKGMIKYDFDAENVDIPVYEFAYALPEEVGSLDLHAASASERNWRQLTKNRPKEPTEMQFIDRLVEIERLKTQTVEWESKRDARLRHLRRQRLTLSRISSATSRVQSAKSRDRRCCKGCLQPACVGDCPDRGSIHDDSLSIGVERSDTPYDLHTRSNRADSEQSRMPRKPRPKSCTQCQRRHNAKLINANNVVLGRPRSSYATYSRGQGSNVPRDFRPETPVTNYELDNNFEKLGIESYKTKGETSDELSNGKTEPRLFRGRAATIPGKSYFSNRRYSLTNSNIQSRINSGRKKRPKSSKRYKPKS